MGLAKRAGTLVAALALVAGVAQAATDVGGGAAHGPAPIRADEPIRVAQFLLGDELACAFDAYAINCMMREMNARLERMGPGLADRYEALYFRWLLQSSEGALAIVQPEVDMIDIDYIDAVEAMRDVYQGNMDAALAALPSIRSPDARILVWHAISEWRAASGAIDAAVDALQSAQAELSALSPGARVQAAEEIAWALHRLGDDDGARAVAAIGRAALAESDAAPTTAVLAGMSLAGTLCAVSPKEAQALLGAGVEILEADMRPPELDDETWHFATVLAAAWASRSYARCGDVDTANLWAERMAAGLEGLTLREQAHVYATMVRRTD